MFSISETPGFFSTSPTDIMYLFFEKFLLAWHIVLELRLLLLPDDLLYVAS